MQNRNTHNHNNNNHNNHNKNKNNHSKYNNQLHTMIYNILNERITVIKYMNAD